MSVVVNECEFFSLNGLFDTEVVHLYLSDKVQMSITYHNDPEILSLTMDIHGLKNNVLILGPEN